jgi:hypothetical protein
VHAAKEDSVGIVEAVVVVVIEATVVLGAAVEVTPAVADIAEPTTPAAAAAQRFARPTIGFKQTPYNVKKKTYLLIFTSHLNFHHHQSPHIHCHSSSTRSSSYVGQVVEDRPAYASLLQPAQKEPGLGSCGSPVWY